LQEQQEKIYIYIENEGSSIVSFIMFSKGSGGKHAGKQAGRQAGRRERK
jgi:hypothetical protein